MRVMAGPVAAGTAAAATGEGEGRAPLVGAFDLGGTKCLCGLVDPAGHVLAEERFPSHLPGGPDAVADRMVRTLLGLLDGLGRGLDDVAAIGVCSPGPLDPEAGVVIDAANLRWRNVPLREVLRLGLGRAAAGARTAVPPITLEVDCHAAALGEKWLGAGRDFDHLAYVVVGTGVGVGLVLNGRVYRGARALGGELGHLVIDPNGRACTCGRYGCLEAYVSGPAIALRGAQSLATGRPTALAAASGADPARVTAEVIFDAARGGDEAALEIVAEVAAYLGQGLAALIQLLNPQAVLLGGGVICGWDLLEDGVWRALRRHSLAPHLEGLQVRPGALGYRAGLLGAALEAWEASRLRTGNGEEGSL